MENTSNKAMISPNVFHLFPLRIFHFLYNIISNFLLSHWSSFGSLFLFVRDHEVKFEQKDLSFEGLSKKKSARFEEAGIDDDDDDNECYLLGKDINMVMKRLGIEKHGVLEGEEVKKRWGCDEISRVFEEDEEVRLEEVREAFDVFDQDKDGFIDARDLQRVLLALGFWQGKELKACTKMIRVFDDDGDEKLDFHEFVRLISLNKFE